MDQNDIIFVLITISNVIAILLLYLKSYDS